VIVMAACLKIMILKVTTGDKLVTSWKQTRSSPVVVATHGTKDCGFTECFLNGVCLLKVL